VEAGPLSPPDALRGLAEIANRDDALKARTEGLTWVLWGFVNLGVAMTYLALLPEEAFLGAPDLASPAVLLVGLYPLTGILATVGLWRSAALSFPTGMSFRRGLLFFTAFLVIVTVLSLGFLPFVGWEQGVLGKSVAVGLFLLGFGALNPLGFTRSGRGSAFALGAIALLGGAAGLAAGLTGTASVLLATGTLGWAWVAVGLWALYHG